MKNKPSRSRAINIFAGDVHIPWHSPRQRVDEQRDNDHRDDDAGEVDRRDLVDLRLRRPLQVLVAPVAEDAEISATQLDLVPAVGAVAAAAATAAAVAAVAQHCTI